MSEDVILVVDFNSVCRFCLQSNGTLSCIFSGEENPLVSSQLECFTDIRVEQDDSFPSKICHKCRYKIEFCFEFREMVLRTQKALSDNINNDSEETKYDVETLDSSFETENDDNKQYNIESKKKAKKTTTHQNAFEDYMTSNKLDPKTDMNNIFLLHQDQPSDEDNIISPSCGNSLIENLQEQYLDNGLSVFQIKSKKNKPRRYEKKIKYSPFSKMKDYPSMLTASRRNQCLLCLEKCDNPSSLKEHVNKHTEGTELEPYYKFGERDISCKACHKTFGYRFSFLTHQREHLDLKPFICHFEGCGLAFYSNSSLRQHLPIHGDKRFICSMCAVGFKRKSDLKAHEIIHKDAGILFSCPICKLTCKNRLTLAAHVRKHCNQPRFKCSKCPKSYFSRSELERHTNIHTGEKRFRCAACPSAYFSRAALVRHERGHTAQRGEGEGALGEGAHRKCPLCPRGNSFGTWQEYKMHMKGHSSYDFPYRCPHCQKGYFVKNSLTKHLSFCGSDPALQLLKPDEIAHQYDMKNTTYVRLLQPLVKEEDVEEMLHGRQELDSIMVDSGNGGESQQLFIVDMIQEQIEE